MAVTLPTSLADVEQGRPVGSYCALCRARALYPMLYTLCVMVVWHPCALAWGEGLVPLSAAAFPLALLFIDNHDLAKDLAISTLLWLLQ